MTIQLTGNPAPARAQTLNRYWALSYLLILANLSPLLNVVAPAWPTVMYELTVYLTYGFIYLLPAILIVSLAARCRLDRRVTLPLAIVVVSLIQVFLFADRVLFATFSFHVNGFVWNLVTTPGGIASMGADNSTVATFAAISAALVAAQVAAMLLSCRSQYAANGAVPG